MLLRERLHQFENRVYRSKGGLWAQGLFVPKNNNIIGVLRTPRGKILILGHNIVTDDGDTYYAKVGAQESPTPDFGAASSEIAVLDNSGAGPGKSSNFSNIGSPVGSGNPQAFDGSYPQSNDGDGDNPNAAIDTVTYLVSYATGEANGTIDRAAIHLTGASGTDALLMYGAFSQFTKTSNDTLKVFINHNMLGV